jgi:hypothetical protein
LHDELIINCIAIVEVPDMLWLPLQLPLLLRVLQHMLQLSNNKETVSQQSYIKPRKSTQLPLLLRVLQHMLQLSNNKETVSPQSYTVLNLDGVHTTQLPLLLRILQLMLQLSNNKETVSPQSYIKGIVSRKFAMLLLVSLKS